MADHTFSFDYDCSTEAFFDFYSNTTVETNTDISGVGVIIGFVGTAVLAFCLLAFYYVVVHDPNQNPFACCDKPFGPQCHTLGHRPTHWRPNSIDLRFLSWVRKGRISEDWAIAREPISETILNLCDIQALTGHAILVSGFISLTDPTNPISMGDWHTLAYIAWFSTITHLSGLTILRQPYYRGRLSKYVRLGSMSLLLVLVCIALVPTGYLNDLYPGTFAVKKTSTFTDYNGTNHTSISIPLSATLYRSPAACYLDLRSANRLWWYGQDRSDTTKLPLMSTIAMQSMLMAICTLMIGFLSRVVKLSRFFSHGITSCIRGPLSRGMRGLILSMFHSDHDGQTMACKEGKQYWRRVWVDLAVLPAFGVFLLMRWTVEIYTSMIFEVIWIAVVIIWGYIKLAALRSMGASAKSDGPATSRGSWTFGQIMAIALLASPVIMVAGKFIIWKRGLIVRDKSHGFLRQLSSMHRRDSIGLDSLQYEASDNQQLLAQEHDSTLPYGPRYSHSTSKRQLVHGILDADVGLIPTWLDICNTAACLWWLCVLLIAIILTNHVVYGQVTFSFSTLWFGYTVGIFLPGGVFWAMTITHPMIYALCIATFIEFHSPASNTRSSDASSMTIKKKWSLGLICLIVQAGPGTVATIISVPTRNPVVSHIAIAVACYIIYFIIYSSKHLVQWLRKAVL